MIKIYKLKTIVIVLLVIVLIAGFVLMLKNKTKYESIQTSNNSSTYKILVDVEESKLYLFEDNEVIKTYKCSGGKMSTPSPIGTWTIISKAKWGEGFGRKLDGIKCSLG